MTKPGLREMVLMKETKEMVDEMMKGDEKKEMGKKENGRAEPAVALPLPICWVTFKLRKFPFFFGVIWVYRGHLIKLSIGFACATFSVEK